jgi:hypothetical protein
MIFVRLRSLILPLVLIAIAAKLVELGITGDGVGPFEYATLALLVALCCRALFACRVGPSGAPSFAAPISSARRLPRLCAHGEAPRAPMWQAQPR